MVASYLRRSTQLADELRKHQRRRLARFVKEDANALDRAQMVAAIQRGELRSAVGCLFDDVRGREPVLGFGLPLLFFAESPEDQEGCEDT